jgi:hypothetical protein
VCLLLFIILMKDIYSKYRYEKCFENHFNHSENYNEQLASRFQDCGMNLGNPNSK